MLTVSITSQVRPIKMDHLLSILAAVKINVQIAYRLQKAGTMQYICINLAKKSSMEHGLFLMFNQRKIKIFTGIIKCPLCAGNARSA